jgi:putative transposase
MFSVIAVLTGTMLRVFRTRRDLLLENLTLRQQLTVLKRKRPRPRIAALDKLFWVLARRFWSGWKQALIVVTPDTVVRWHRSGFALYWRVISRARRVVGRRRISKEVRDLILRMVKENPTWGAPRIHGELQMVGVDISERTISRWMRRAPRDPEPAKRWLAFLRNHRKAIAAMDFCTVSTITFGVFYCFLVIVHDRRRILHFNVTRHPTSLWVVQQLREAFPFGSAPRFVIFDRDAKYGAEVPTAIRSMKIKCVRTSLRSPWQNGIAERWVESCRRDLLDHVIALSERHLSRLLADYVSYYHDDRTHLGLEKGTPNGRARCMAICSSLYIYALHARTLVPAPERTSRSSKQFLIKFRLFTLQRKERIAPHSARMRFWRGTAASGVSFKPLPSCFLSKAPPRRDEQG